MFAATRRATLARVACGRAHLLVCTLAHVIGLCLEPWRRPLDDTGTFIEAQVRPGFRTECERAALTAASTSACAAPAAWRRLLGSGRDDIEGRSARRYPPLAGDELAADADALSLSQAHRQGGEGQFLVAVQLRPQVAVDDGGALELARRSE